MSFFRTKNLLFCEPLWGGDTRDIAEPTYKTFNLPTRHKYDRKLDFQLTYKTFNQLLDINPTAHNTFNQLTKVPTYQLGFKPKD